MSLSYLIDRMLSLLKANPDRGFTASEIADELQAPSADAALAMGFTIADDLVHFGWDGDEYTVGYRPREEEDGHAD
jgi:hypothetical protein